MSDKKETAQTVVVNGVEYERRRSKSDTLCKGCALKYASVDGCNRLCGDGYVLQRARRAALGQDEDISKHFKKEATA